MMIKIGIVNKFAAQLGGERIVCGNNDYTVKFEFDAEWDGVEYKTARFVYVQDGIVKSQDVVFQGDTIEGADKVPVFTNVREVLIGVFAGDLKTTTPARVGCERSIRCGTAAPADPTSDVYDQIMEMLNQGGSGGGGGGPETDPTVPDWAKEPNKPVYTASEVGAVPTSRKIAGNDLTKDITVEALQDNLSVYPIVELSRKPKSAPEQELELKGKVGQFGILKSGKIAEFYRCISVTKHPQYGGEFIYEWEYLGTNSNCTYVPFSIGDLNYLGGAPLRGNMVYSDSSEKALYIRVLENQPLVKIPIVTDIVTAIDANSTDEQIPSAKLFYDTVGSVETALDSIIAIQENLIGGVTE